MIKSPSFSLFSSSMTTRNSPAAKALRASSKGSNENAPLLGGFLTFLGCHVVEIESCLWVPLTDSCFVIVETAATGAMDLYKLACKDPSFSGLRNLSYRLTQMSKNIRQRRRRRVVYQ